MTETLCLAEVVRDPDRAAERLSDPGRVYGLGDIVVRVADDDLVVFWLTLAPWAPMAVRGYPTEHVAVTVWPGGRVTAVPAPSHRTWYHRYPLVLGDLEMLGQLCLWYPWDPPSRRWDWDDGLDVFITIAHRHLQAEEYYRRHRTWPAIDVPHGSSGPMETPDLFAAARGEAD